MNTELVAVGVDDNRRTAAGQVERFMGELDVVTPEMLDRPIEVLDF